MLELGMVICLTLMGVYFFKSAELPKELRERSAQTQSELNHSMTTKKKAFPKVTLKQAETKIEIANEISLNEKIQDLKKQKKLKDIAILEAEIDRLTMEITSLELQIKENNSKNAEIQKQIDLHIATLLEVQAKIHSMA